ncbi:MAG: A24 family peptidase [Gammaproteobacteria bacterium]
MSIITEAFIMHPAFFLAAVFLFSLMVGSFLNVVILRLPVMMKKEWREECCEFLELKTEEKQQTSAFNLVVPRSRCPNCQHLITALENIPVISYLFLKGRCKECGTRISLRYPAIELLTALASVSVAYYFGVTIQTLFAIILTWALIALSFIDIDEQLLPDNITLPFLWLGIALNSFTDWGFTTSQSSLLGAILGYGSLWTVYIIFKLVTGKEGMGHGDFKLLAMLGAWLGWIHLPVIIIMSSLVGAVIGIAMIVLKSRDRTIPIPFGPYLAIAGWVSMFWGNYLISSYLNLML